MIGAYASALAICAASVAIGQAIMVLAGRRDFSWLSAPVGLAALVVVSGVAVKLPGHSTAVLIALVGLLAAAAGVLLVWRPTRSGAGAVPILAAGVALVFASLPFIAAGRVGILGVGLVNDDMSYHLLIADWIGSHVGHMPTLVRQGYPVGPHALVGGLAKIFGTSLTNSFAGLTLAIPALMAMVAAGALERVRSLSRVAVGAIAALSYLGAAYLAQEAFKEPIEALFLLGFALYLPTVTSVRDGMPTAVLSAGAVYTYSFPGLFWLAGATLAYWGLARPRGVIRPFLAAHVLLLVLVAPEIGRLIDFSHFKAFSESTANSGGLGNLRHQLSPLEAFGVWPTSEFRLAASDAGHPIAYYAGSLLALGAFAAGAPRWVRRYGWGVPAALGAAVVIYAGARVSGTVYTSAKALSIAAPLVLLIGLGGLTAARDEEPWSPWLLRGLAVAAGVAALGSSFLVLRQAPVGPTTHADELATFRPVIGDRKVLFLGRDDFIQYELHPARPYVAVRNYYDNFYVKPNLALKDVFDKFDFDSVKVDDLARFRYVITTRASFASQPPPAFAPLRLTRDFVLWERRGTVGPRHVLDEGDNPGVIRDCSTHDRGGFAVTFDRAPQKFDGWSGATVEGGSPVTQSVTLPAGAWNVSLQYDASRPLHLTAPGLDSTVPANLDYRGTTPYYAAGRIEVKRAGTVEVTASTERPPLVGRLLGASPVAHLGAIAFTAAGPPLDSDPLPGHAERTIPFAKSCGRYVDWYAAG